MSKTLENARDGLLQYWAFRPNGGTRAELIQLAVNQGFVEPLLNEWLDVFLGGFVAAGYLATPNYDLALVPRLQEVGIAKATVAVHQVFEFLTRDRRDLDVVRKENLLQQVEADLAALEAGVANATTGRAWLVANAPSGAQKTASLAALDEGLAVFGRRIVGLTERRDGLIADIAAIEGS